MFNLVEIWIVLKRKSWVLRTVSLPPLADLQFCLSRCFCTNSNSFIPGFFAVSWWLLAWAWCVFTRTKWFLLLALLSFHPNVTAHLRSTWQEIWKITWFLTNPNGRFSNPIIRYHAARGTTELYSWRLSICCFCTFWSCLFDCKDLIRNWSKIPAIQFDFSCSLVGYQLDQNVLFYACWANAKTYKIRLW